MKRLLPHSIPLIAGNTAVSPGANILIFFPTASAVPQYFFSAANGKHRH
jgi:hypothetical protein